VNDFDADPLMDSLVTCQGCQAQLFPHEVCEHEDWPGPCCVDLCCPRHHEHLEAA
jgi:hypothetical protein